MKRPTVAAWLLVAGAVVPWFFPSNVVRLIALGRPIVLGRYGVGHFAVLFFVSLLLLFLASLCWMRRTRTRREVAFRALAVSFAVVFTLVLLDVGGRLLRKDHYEQTAVDTTRWPDLNPDETIIRRPANQHYRLTVVDAPRYPRSYPNAPRGEPREVELTTDARGFRNAQALDACDLLVIGDSFAEGNKVSDDEAWPVLLGKARGEVVYNLGMSGCDPDHYLAALKSIGAGLKPKLVVCMLFGGNDFKGPRRKASDLSFGGKVEMFFETSPVTRGFRAGVIGLLGPINADGDVRGIDTLSWLPVRVPEGEGGLPYVCLPKEVQRLALSEAQFRASPGWTHAAGVLREMKSVCDEIGARLVVSFAATKMRVVLPLARERIPVDKMHAFVAFRNRGALLAPEQLAKAVFDGAGSKEAVLRAFCEAEQIPFVSVTKPLIDGTARGERLFHIYDFHWTARGNAVVADALADGLAALPQ